MTERAGRSARKQVLLRLDPAVHDALARWAADELRSTNAQIDYLLRRALAEAGRQPKGARPHPRRGRPPRRTGQAGEAGVEQRPGGGEGEEPGEGDGAARGQGDVGDGCDEGDSSRRG